MIMYVITHNMFIGCIISSVITITITITITTGVCEQETFLS